MWPFKRRATADAGAANSSSEPAAKRARHCGSSESSGVGGGAKDKVLGSQGLLDAQLELQLLDERCAEEQISIQQRYDQLRRPHFDKRGKKVRSIPGFWKSALCGHPSRLVAPFESEALEHIIELDVRENVDRRGSYEVRVQFGKNVLFKERSAVKKVTFHDALTEQVEAATLTAASDRGLEILASARGVQRSVLGWLISPQSAGAAEVGHDFSEVLRRDLWQDPIPYFVAYHDANAAATASAASDSARSAARTQDA